MSGLTNTSITNVMGNIFAAADAAESFQDTYVGNIINKAATYTLGDHFELGPGINVTPFTNVTLSYDNLDGVTITGSVFIPEIDVTGAVLGTTYQVPYSTGLGWEGRTEYATLSTPFWMNYGASFSENLTTGDVEVAGSFGLTALIAGTFSLETDRFNPTDHSEAVDEGAWLDNVSPISGRSAQKYVIATGDDPETGTRYDISDPSLFPTNANLTAIAEYNIATVNQIGYANAFADPKVIEEMSYTADDDGEYLVAEEYTGTLTGGDGDDYLVGSVLNKIDGGDGYDIFDMNASPVPQTFLVHGGEGWIDDQVINVDQFFEEYEQLELTGIEAVIGSQDHQNNIALSRGMHAAVGGNLADLLTGGPNDDILAGGLGADTIKGNGGSDIVSYRGESAGITIDLRSGENSQDDILESIEGVFGTNHRDVIKGGNDESKISGNGGNDNLHGYSGEDEIYGGSGNDKIYGGADDDLAYGGSGNDQLRGYDDDDKLSGGKGSDKVYGMEGSDRLYGNGSSDKLYGGDGVDFLDGGYGNDTIYTGEGKDTIRFDRKEGEDVIKDFTNNKDTLLLRGFDKYFASAEYALDHYLVNSGGNGILTIGDDKVTVEGLTRGYLYNDMDVQTREGDVGLTQDVGSSGNDVLTTEDALYGEGGEDKLYGGSNEEYLYGGSGDDRIYSKGGNDVMSGGSGDDYLRNDGGNDFVYGGSGTDAISYYGASEGVHVDLETGYNSTGDYLSSIEDLWGTNGKDDRLHGDDSDNNLRGLAGEDRLDGGSGDDKLQGGDGDDTIYANGDEDRLYGGNGSDFLDGGYGDDQLTGGLGADVFHFDKREDHDVIKDFENNVDTIELDGFGFATVAEAMAYASKDGDDVIFDFGGGDTLLVEDTTIGRLLNDIELQGPLYTVSTPPPLDDVA